MNKEIEIKKCDVCGITSDSKIICWCNKIDMYLCSKHKKQIYEYGKIIDPTPRTQQDKNEIVICDTYAEIIIRDRKNNVLGKAIIDLDDLDKIKKYKWRLDSRKDKLNGYIAAGNSKNRITLHRLILNYDGPLQVDHINRNKLDNRKENLRIVPNVTNSQNINARNIRCINGKYRVEIIRFGKLYNLGSFPSFNEALKVKNNFLQDIEENREQLVNEYMSKQPNEKNIRYTIYRNYIVEFYVKGHHYRITKIPTLEEAISIRDAKIKELRNM